MGSLPGQGPRLLLHLLSLLSAEQKAGTGREGAEFRTWVLESDDQGSIQAPAVSVV